MRLAFLLQNLVLFLLIGISALNAEGFGPKVLMKKVENAVAKAAQKGVKTKIPTFDESKWKVHVLAEQEAVSLGIEVTANSFIYVGQKLITESLTIHGDGILFVEGDLVCPVVDIKGNAIVIFKQNHVKYFGGQLKIGSGLIIGEKDNYLDIRIKDGGAYHLGGNNRGEIIVSNGAAILNIAGHQVGDMTFGKGSGSRIEVGKMLKGDLDAQQNCHVIVKLDIDGDMKVQGDLGLAGRELMNSKVDVSGTLNAELGSISKAEGQNSSISASAAAIKVKRDSESDISVQTNLKAVIGGSHLGNIEAKTGSMDVAASKDCKGDLSSGADTKLAAANFRGKVSAKGNAEIQVKEICESYLIEVSKNCLLKAKIFRGNAKIGGAGDFSANDFNSSEFYYHSMEFGSAKVQAVENNELEIIVKNDGIVKVGQENSAKIRVGGNADVNIGQSNTGAIVVGKNGKIQVKNNQIDPVFVGGNGAVAIGTAHKTIIIKGKADVKLGESLKSYYDTGWLQVGFGSIQVTKDNHLKIITKTKGELTSFKIGGDNLAGIDSAGKIDGNISGNQNGDVVVAEGGKYNVSKDQEGAITSGGAIEGGIAGTLKGDILIKKNPGKSSLKIGNIIDSNIAVYAFGSFNINALLDQEPGKEKVFLSKGEFIAKENIEADVMSEGDVLVQAKNIYGNVDIGSESSKVDAVVKGQVQIIQ